MLRFEYLQKPQNALFTGLLRLFSRFCCQKPDDSNYFNFRQGLWCKGWRFISDCDTNDKLTFGGQCPHPFAAATERPVVGGHRSELPATWAGFLIIPSSLKECCRRAMRAGAVQRGCAPTPQNGTTCRGDALIARHLDIRLTHLCRA